MSTLSNKIIPELAKFVNLHRVLGKRGYQYGIENHLSLIVDKHPLTGNRALLTSIYGLDWTHCTENDIFAVDMDSKQVIDQQIEHRYEESFLLNMLSIHAGVAMNRNDIKCIIHTHPLSICTLIGLCPPYNKIMNVHQNSIRFNSITKIGYDEEYATFENNEYDKYSALIGKDNDILFLANHGVVVCADCVELAWDRFYFLDIAAQIQLNIYNTQKDIKYIPQTQCDLIANEWTLESEKRSAQFHFDAAVNSLCS